MADTGNAETGYTDDSANEPGVRYTYRVKALRGGEQSKVSNYANIDLPDDYAQDTPEPAPEPEEEPSAEALAPSGLTAEAAEDGGVALSWTAPAEDAASVTGYEVLRAQGEAELTTLEADTGNTDTAYTDETASEAGETYAYQVKALRGEEKSQGSNRAEAFIPATTLTEPAPPVAALQSGVTVVPADWSLIPSGLSHGDEFRLLFVSSTGRNASSDSIATYNTWIQNRAAAGHTDIQDYSSTFTAVGSTAAVDARDNTHTTYTSSDKGVPIYWLNGNKVADHYEDFYDEDWDEEANRKDEDGTASSDVTIRTGSDHDGTEKGSGTSSTALGKSPSTVGFPNSSTSGFGPLSSTGTSGENTHLPLYGLSGVFRVAPPPPTMVPADWSLIPSSLGEGDQFRLLFLSSTKRSIRSTNISDYNTFVQNRAAAGHTDIQDYSGTFRVLGSTDAVAARDNTHTTYTSSEKGVRIYWLNGDKAADQYQDFYDGSWDQQADAWNESGGEYNLSARRFVATGSSKDGTTDQSNTLGASSGEVQLGCLYETSSTNGPVSCRFTTENIGADDNQQLYGLSGVFQVVTNNATGAPTISGTPEVNQTLTADVSGIMDADGLPAADQFSYQWIRSDGTDDSDISGATDSTYKLKAADLGKTIKVRVTFTDGGGTEETLTSDATTAVAADTTGPVVEEVICFDSFCTLLFDELLDGNVDHSPPTNAFAITADGAAITVGGAFPLIDGRFQLSSLAPQIYQGQAVIVTYTDPTAGNDEAAIQDEAGNDASSFTTGEDGVPAVTNNSTVEPSTVALVSNADGTIESAISRTIQAQSFVTGPSTGGYMLSTIQVRLGDDSALPGVADLIVAIKADDGSGEPGALVANLANPASLTNDALNTFAAPTGTVLAPDTTYWVVVNEERNDTDRVNLRVTAQDEEDEAFPGWSIGNNHLSKVSASGSWNHGATVSNLIVVSGSVIVGTADTTGPVVQQVSCFDSFCTLLFDELLDGNVGHSPPTNAFAITADGAAITVGGAFPLIDGRFQLSSLTPQIYQGQTVTVTYTDPTAGNDEAAIQDEAGNDASSFTTGEDGVPAVTNNSTLAAPPLVSNIGQTAATGAANVSTTQSSAQGFTTGTNTGGYTLDSVELAVTPFDGTASDITVSIYSESSGDPGTLVHTLTTPASLSDPVTTFSAPSGATLAASTTYYVVVSTTSTLFLLSRTEATAEDTGGASGWSIADDRRFSRNLVTWTTATVPIRMRINGDAATATTSTITEVPADWSLVPSGLQEGDQFRLLFISSAHRNASPSEIATYNTWIQARAANGHTDIQDYSSSFRAVGSTEDMDARDNTGTTYTSSDKGVAIYWLNGNKVADDYEDFYDEDWDEEASMKNESGTAESGVSAWTGSDHDGTESFNNNDNTSRALGNSNNAWVRFGRTDSANHGPLSGATAARNNNRRIYGLSSVFEVVAGNNPATGTVTSGSITQTTAVITVTIANPDTNSQTVNLQYKRNADTAWTDVSPKSTVSAAVTFNLTGLTGNTDYDVRASLDSAFASGVKTATFTTSPTKPGKTRFVDASTTESGTLFITWQEPDSDGGSAITGYTVQWKSGSQSFGGDPSREHTTMDSIPDYLITGLTNGTEYTVRVIAVNAVGDGPPSDTDSGTPVGPRDAPPNVQAGSGHEQLTVSWGAPNDGGSAIIEYTLQWKSGGQNFISSQQRTIAAPSRTDTIPSLANGTEYTVRVRATTALGDSGWSAEAKGTPREGPHVSTVRVKEPISCAVSFVALEFVNLEAATEYQAHLRFRAQDSSSWTVLSPQGFWSSGLPGLAADGELNGPSPSFTLPDLAYETAYEVQAALDSGFVDGLATTTFSTPDLSEAGLMTLSPGDGTLGLRMTRPTSEGRVDGYLLQWKSSDEEYDDTDTSERQADVPGSGDREYTITGLDNGVEYTVRAMAYNDNGVGVPSDEVRGTPEAPPNSPARGAPTISGTAQVGETLTADTGGIEDDDGLADAVYSYQWLADGADISGATGDTYTLVADDQGKVISVRVSFIDDRDFEETLTSEPTEEVAEDPDAPTEPPNAPRTVRIVGDTNTSLTLTWDAPEGGTSVTEYRVQWLTVGENFGTARGDGREAVLGASARSHTITGLTEYKFYQVRVLAVNGAGESEGSNTAWGITGLGEGQYGHG